MSETSIPTPESAPLVWIDCEMTGLHPQVDELVEVAVLITDAELNILDEGIDLVIRPSAAAFEQMDPF
ncbi:oligoribonuclease, partial [Xanthomonas citri pv. citri]|nr:oligoribonuclease [Xanthomonas citri pv. citri]